MHTLHSCRYVALSGLSCQFYQCPFFAVVCPAVDEVARLAVCLNISTASSHQFQSLYADSFLCYFALSVLFVVLLLLLVRCYTQTSSFATLTRACVYTSQALQHLENLYTVLKATLTLWRDRLPAKWDHMSEWCMLLSFRQKVFEHIGPLYMELNVRSYPLLLLLLLSCCSFCCWCCAERQGRGAVCGFA